MANIAGEVPDKERGWYEIASLLVAALSLIIAALSLIIAALSVYVAIGTYWAQRCESEASQMQQRSRLERNAYLYGHELARALAINSDLHEPSGKGQKATTEAQQQLASSLRDLAIYSNALGVSTDERAVLTTWLPTETSLYRETPYHDAYKSLQSKSPEATSAFIAGYWLERLAGRKLMNEASKKLQASDIAQISLELQPALDSIKLSDPLKLPPVINTDSVGKASQAIIAYQKTALIQMQARGSVSSSGKCESLNLTWKWWLTWLWWLKPVQDSP